RLVLVLTRAGAADARSAESASSMPAATASLAIGVVLEIMRVAPILRHSLPGAVRLAAGGAAHRLRPAVDIDRVAVLPARHTGALIGGTGDHSAVAPGILVAPAHRRARRSGVERLHLRRIGTGAIIVIERSTDAVADQPADGRAGKRARDAAAAA